MKHLVLFLLISFLSFSAVAKEEFIVNGVLTSEDSMHIPVGPGYTFQIKVQYNLISIDEIPVNGTTIRNYSLDAILPAANPSMAYLGKSMLLISDRLALLCQKIGEKAEKWKFIDISTLKHLTRQSLDQEISFNFSCYDRGL